MTFKWTKSPLTVCNVHPCVPRSAPGIDMRVEHLSSRRLKLSHWSSSEKSSQSNSPLQRRDWLMQRPGWTKTVAGVSHSAGSPPQQETTGGVWGWYSPVFGQVKLSPQWSGTKHWAVALGHASLSHNVSRHCCPSNWEGFSKCRKRNWQNKKRL